MAIVQWKLRDIIKELFFTFESYTILFLKKIPYHVICWKGWNHIININ
jgi:hypothetical protein